MNKYLIVFIMVLSSLIAGCKGEDGEDGKVYVEVEWTSDISALDLSNILKDGQSPSSYYENTKYELEPGVTGIVYWKSNNTVYSFSVTVEDVQSGKNGGAKYILVPEDGDDGDHSVQRVGFSGNTISDLGTRSESQFRESIENKSVPSTVENIDEAIEAIKGDSF